jgi:hypothetical protein
METLKEALEDDADKLLNRFFPPQSPEFIRGEVQWRLIHKYACIILNIDPNKDIDKFVSVSKFILGAGNPYAFRLGN